MQEGRGGRGAGGGGGGGGRGGRAGSMTEDWKYLTEISLNLGCRLVQVFQFTIASLHTLNRDKTESSGRNFV